jgi:hypothetical protein
MATGCLQPGSDVGVAVGVGIFPFYLLGFGGNRLTRTEGTPFREPTEAMMQSFLAWP